MAMDVVGAAADLAEEMAMMVEPAMATKVMVEPAKVSLVRMASNKHLLARVSHVRVNSRQLQQIQTMTPTCATSVGGPATGPGPAHKMTTTPTEKKVAGEGMATLIGLPRASGVAATNAWPI